MATTSRAEKKAAVDAAAWVFNVVTSVGVIIVNKALMASYGFSFGKFLFQFLVTPFLDLHCWSCGILDIMEGNTNCDILQCTNLLDMFIKSRILTLILILILTN